MRNLNRVVLTGGLTHDPELRHTPSGTPVTTLRLGYTTQRRVGGEWQDRSNYVDVELWGAQAESAVRYLNKGRQVAVDGRLEWREYETRAGGRRQVHSIVADSVEFLAKPRADGSQGTPAAPPEPVLAGGSKSVEDDIPF
jgi:single-strand DNA-binding protein